MASGTNSRAFTLIELLVAITIIVVLLALLAPALDRAVEAATRARCAAQQHSLVSILNVYASENQRKYPPTGMDCGGESIFQLNTKFVDLIISYAGDNNGGVRTVTPGTGWTSGGLTRMLFDPSFKDFGAWTNCGWVVGWQVLFSRPMIEAANNVSPYPEWKSPMGLSNPGSGQLVTCLNNWAFGDGTNRAWVAHSQPGGPLGEDADVNAYWYLTGSASPDPRTFGESSTAGGNIARVDASVTWTSADLMTEHPATSNARNSVPTYLCLW